MAWQVVIAIPCHMLRFWAFLGMMFQVGERSGRAGQGRAGQGRLLAAQLFCCSRENRGAPRWGGPLEPDRSPALSSPTPAARSWRQPSQLSWQPWRHLACSHLPLLGFLMPSVPDVTLSELPDARCLPASLARVRCPSSSSHASSTADSRTPWYYSRCLHPCTCDE